MEFSHVLKAIRMERGLSQEEMAKLLGTSKQVISRYENGQRVPKISTVAEYASILGVPISILSGNPDIDSFDGVANIIPFPSTYQVPILGEIACGQPILAEEHIVDYASVPEHVSASFALICKGDSMIGARIYDGDLVYIRQQETVENGEIAAVLIGTEATLKRVYIIPGHMIELRAENPAYPPLRYMGEEMRDVRILGKATYFLSAVR